MPVADPSLIIPPGYRPSLDLRETQVAIKRLKDLFERELARELHLTRVTAPLFVRTGIGLNDDLNGVERPVSFVPAAALGEQDSVGAEPACAGGPPVGDGRARLELVQSLAKWKRMALARYGFGPGEGIYTDMNAVRQDERLDNLHSIYVDQWDWEKVITRDERNLETLRAAVEGIYQVLRLTEDYLAQLYPGRFRAKLPRNIRFISTQELEDRFPDLSPAEREDRATREYRAVCLEKIGGTLRSGRRHDGRAPDYDDWECNCDILLWHPILGRTCEISSMGVRVDEATLERQLALAGCEDRRALDFHAALLRGELPLTMGGGIGQSRLCLFFLEKAHIGEVQASVWPEAMAARCREAGIPLL